MLQWALAPDGLFVQFAVLALTGAACVFSPSRALAAFVLAALLLWAVATPFFASGAMTLRGGVAAAVWTLAVVGLPALVLGPLIAWATRPRILMLVAGVLWVVQVPLAFVSQVLLQCHVGHYCPGL